MSEFKDVLIGIQIGKLYECCRCIVLTTNEFKKQKKRNTKQKYTNKWINATPYLGFMLLNKIISVSSTVCFQLNLLLFYPFPCLNLQIISPTENSLSVLRKLFSIALGYNTSN